MARNNLHRIDDYATAARYLGNRDGRPLAHNTTIERLKEDKPGQVRRYLTDVQDYTALREWDRSQMKEST